jgi:hypothetical protein
VSVVDRLREELDEIGARLERLTVLVNVSSDAATRAEREIAALEEWRRRLLVRVNLLEQVRP